MKAVKITNPHYIQYAAPEIKKYVEKIKQDGITYESFITFLQQTAQFGGEISQLWMVVKDNIPVAFMQMNLSGPPYVGTCSLNHICSWAKDKQAVDLLIGEYLNFGARHNCTFLLGYAVNSKLFKYYKTKAEGVGYEYKSTGVRPFSCRKKHENIQRDKD